MNHVREYSIYSTESPIQYWSTPVLRVPGSRHHVYVPYKYIELWSSQHIYHVYCMKTEIPFILLDMIELRYNCTRTIDICIMHTHGVLHCLAMILSGLLACEAAFLGRRSVTSLVFSYATSRRSQTPTAACPWR